MVDVGGDGGRVGAAKRVSDLGTLMAYVCILLVQDGIHHLEAAILPVLCIVPVFPGQLWHHVGNQATDGRLAAFSSVRRHVRIVLKEDEDGLSARTRR